MTAVCHRVRHGHGKQSLRRNLGPEFAVAVLWAEAALELAEAKNQKMEIRGFLDTVRAKETLKECSTKMLVTASLSAVSWDLK